MEIGIDSFAATMAYSNGQPSISDADRMAFLLEEVEVADRAGLDVFGIGEHHRSDYLDSAPAVILAAAAARTASIRLTSAVTVLSAADPVRVFQEFATLDLISRGRAEIVVGRGSSIEAYPLFGFDLADYDALFAEKLDLLLAVRERSTVDWSGKFRPSLSGQGIYPRPQQERLPIWLGVGGTPQSFIRAGTLGLPLMVAIIGGQFSRFRPLVDLYRRAGEQAGHAPEILKVGIHALGFVAETNKEAEDRFFPGWRDMFTKVGRERGWPPATRAQFDQSVGPHGAFLVGDPDRVVAKVLQAAADLGGVDRLTFQMSSAAHDQHGMIRSIELLGRDVRPRVRSNPNTPLDSCGANDFGDTPASVDRKVDKMTDTNEPQLSGADRRYFLAGAAATLALAASGAAVAQSGEGARFDVVIVGGGSAGAVLANRLSADPSRRVLLIEAGKAYATNAYPDPVRRQDLTGGDPAHDWGYSSQPGVIGKSIPLARGKVLGGSSAVNGAVAIRAPRSDHERWARNHDLGALSWEAAQPFYKSLERTSGTGGTGTDGPFPIHQLGDEEVSDQHRAFIASAVAAGHPRSSGFNTAEPLGVGPYAMNTRMGVRLNTGITLLNDAVRARLNLTIRDQTVVDAVIVERGRATKVRLAGGEEIAAGEIILSAGTYASPAVLMRSGIGPSVSLSSLGIPVLADLPVGRRLQDHPAFPTIWSIRRDAVGLAYPPIGAMLWGRSRHATGDEADLNVSTAPLPDDGKSEAKFLLFTALVRPRSMGSLTIASRDPLAAPLIDLGFLTETEDRERLVDGVEIIREIGRHQPFAGMVGGELIPGAAAVSRAAINAVLAGGVISYGHPTSTVPMGGDRDPNAVVDPQGRVRGVKGLRVVDASLWPDVPSVATALPTMMLAESIAATMV